MPRTGAPSISRTLTVMNLVVCGAALLLAGAAFAGYDLVEFRAQAARGLSTQAQIVGANSVSALLFNDPAAATQTLAALRGAPEITWAEIYTADGVRFATYGRRGAVDMPRIPASQREAVVIGTRSISLARRIEVDGMPVGTVHLQAALDAWYVRLRTYGLIVGAVLVVCLLAALGLSRLAQRTIATPLVDVAAVASRVAVERDYSMRAAVAGAHEVRVVADAFNQMLAEIQRRDASLQEAHDHLEERVRQRTDELRASNDELEAFSYSVSHDLRAPLRHVTGFANLLAQHAEPQLDDVGRRYLTTIVESAKRMGALIDDLLAFSRMGRATLAKKRVDLSALVGDAKAEATADVNGRRIEWQVHPLPTVDADPALLRPVFVNLLSNAVKYTATRDVARIEVGANRSNGEVVIYVRDNGVGFDPAYSHKLFGVFQRLHRAEDFAGTGIGLANVRRIVQRHGGRTWAEGRLDAGATFFFSLPAPGDAGPRSVS